MLIQIPQFNGIVPKADADALPPTAAQDALDCNFVGGSLTGLEQDQLVDTVDVLPQGQAVKGGFIWTNTSDDGNAVGLLFSWPYEVDAVRSPLQNDKHNRFYWTGRNGSTTEFKMLPITQAGIDTNLTFSYNIADFNSNIAKVGVIDSSKWDYTLNDFGMSVSTIKTNGSLLSPDQASVSAQFYAVSYETGDISTGTPLPIRGLDVAANFTGNACVDFVDNADGTFTITLPNVGALGSIETLNTKTFNGSTYLGYRVKVNQIWDSFGQATATITPLDATAWYDVSLGPLKPTYVVLDNQEDYFHIGAVKVAQSSMVKAEISSEAHGTLMLDLAMVAPSYMSTYTSGPTGPVFNPTIPTTLGTASATDSGKLQLAISLKIYLKDSSGVVNQSAAYEGKYFENASLNQPAMVGTTQAMMEIESTDRKVFTVSLKNGSSQPMETRAYVMTIVNSLGEESAPSDPVELTFDPGLERAVINIPALAIWASGEFQPPSDSRSVFYERAPGHGFRFYRTATSSTGDTEFLYAFTVRATGIPDLPGDVYIYNIPASNPPAIWAVQDTVETAALGAACPTLNAIRDTNELQTLQGLIRINNGMMAAFKKNEVWISEPYSGAIFKSDGIHTLPVQIVTLVPLESGFLALTNGEPYYFSGQVPEQMASQAIPSDHPCIGRRAATVLGNGVLYLSSDGPVTVNGMQAVIDQNTWSRESWRSDYGLKIVSSQMELANYGHRLVGYFPGAAEGYLFDMDDGNWTRISSRIDFALYMPPKAFSNQHYFSELFFSDGRTAGTTRYLKFAEHLTGARKPFMWHSKEFTAPIPTNLGVVQVFGTGQLYVDVFSDGVLNYTTPLLTLASSGTIARLLSGFRAVKWSFRLRSIDDGSAVKVTKMFVATSISELQGV